MLCANVLSFKIKGSEAIKNALAGVGNPMKIVVWRSSILNLASLNAENTATRKAVHGITNSSQLPDAELKPALLG